MVHTCSHDIRGGEVWDCCRFKARLDCILIKSCLKYIIKYKESHPKILYGTKLNNSHALNEWKLKFLNVCLLRLGYYIKLTLIWDFI